MPEHHSHDAPKGPEDTITLSMNSVYSGAIAVLACLLVLSVFTQGFGVVKSPAQQCPQCQQCPSCQQCPACPGANASAPAANKTPANTTPPVAQPAPTVPKTDKPKVEAFVMSYCPYGFQMQKAVVPVIELLGAKADITIKWVYYAMHGQTEVQENTRQYCIQKEQADKYVKYLRCFVASTNTTACQQEAGIDTAKMDTCYAAADKEFAITDNFNNQSAWLSGRYPQYNVDKAANQQYGVSGSPTLIINGVKASVTRSADAVKTAVCNAFNTKPSECGTTLSATAEAAGAGAIGAGSGTSAPSAGCGG